MKKRDVIEFIESIEDCKDIERIYIEVGIRKDFIQVSYYDRDGVYKKKAEKYKR